MTQYALYGIYHHYRDYYGMADHSASARILAVFSSKDQAIDYAENSIAERKYSTDKLFKKESLLSGFDDYSIHKHTPPPLDPEIFDERSDK